MSMSKRNQPALEQAKRGSQQDPDMYYTWLIGKGYSPASAMQRVAKKFGQNDQEREARLGWAWRD